MVSVRRRILESLPAKEKNLLCLGGTYECLLPEEDFQLQKNISSIRRSPLEGLLSEKGLEKAFQLKKKISSVPRRSLESLAARGKKHLCVEDA